MSAPTFIIDPTAVTRLLSSLMDRAVAVKKITMPAAPRGVVVLASYSQPDGGCAGICWLDVPAAASMAAALTLMPVPIVDESIKGSKLINPLDENVREVLNIFAKLFAAAEAHRVYLSEVYLPPTKLPATLATILARPAATMQVDVTIAGYRPGKMGFITV